MFWGKPLSACTCKDCFFCCKVESDTRAIDNYKQVLGNYFQDWYCRKMKSNNIPIEVRRAWPVNINYTWGYDAEQWYAANGTPLKDFKICGLFKKRGGY